MSMDGAQKNLALQTLDHFKNEVRRNDRLPSLGQCIEIVKSLGEGASSMAIHEVANVILKDLALTTRVLQISNSIEYNRSGHRISTVTQAILILGFAPIRSIAYTILLLEKMADSNQAEQIRNACLLSVIGGIFARALAEKINLEEPEQGFIAAAFSHLGEILIQSIEPEKALEAERLMVAEGLQEREAYTRIFGLHPMQLGKEIGEFLNLPSDITSYIDPYHVSERNLPEVNRRLREIIIISHQVCTVIKRARSGKEIAETLDHLAAKKDPLFKGFDLSGSLRLAIHEIESFYHYQPKNAFWAKTLEFSATTQTKKDPSTSAQASNALPDIHLFHDGVANITGLLVNPTSTIETILSAIAETVYIGFKARNVVLGIRKPEANILTAVTAFGLDAEQLKSDFNLQLDDPCLLTNVSLQSGNDIYINNPRDPKVWPFIPPCIQELNPHSFVLVPLTTEGIQAGIILVDTPGLKWESGVVPAEVTREFKILRHEAVLALRLNGMI